jgi:hypothetical protein
MISLNIKKRWAGDVAQAVKSLLCKCKPLSSNPRLAKKEEKKKEMQN